MWRPRDRERFIGTYDPEHELPDPDRSPGDRWQSDAYRRGAHDSRYAYRMSPDRFESRFGARRDVDRDLETRWRRDARDGGGYGRGYSGDYERSYSRNDAPRYGGPGDRIRRDYGTGYDRDRLDPFGRSFDDYGRDYGRDYGYDYGLEPDYDDEFNEYRWREREASREPKRGPHWDQDRFYGSDRGWDTDRSRDRDRPSSYEGDFGVWERDRDRWRR